MHKKFFKNAITLLFAVILIAGMLFLPEVSVNFALSGLNLWFTKMIPTLFPFMVVSGVLIRLNLVKRLCSPIEKCFFRIFGVGANGVFCILVGFLCGFPMGAKVTADLYKKKELSFKEAEFLLSFCNNIGPVYFCGFVLIMLDIQNKLPFIFGMYGIPLFYGALRFQFAKYLERNQQLCFRRKTAEIRCCETTSDSSVTFMEAVDGAIMAGIESITRLGGYMIFFNLFNMIPRMMMQRGVCAALSYEHKVRFTYFFSCLFEISNGVSLVKNKEPWLVLTMLPFGGLCCMAQTYSFIKDTPLSISKYGIHKLILTVLTCGYYFILAKYVSL